MKRYFILPLIATLVFSLASCEKDDPVTPDTPQKPDVENSENPDKPDEPDTPAPGENEDKNLDVTINPDGTTSTGVPFKWESDSKTTFYLNHVKYRIVDTHLEAVGVDEYELKLSLGGKVKLYRSVTIDGCNYILRALARGFSGHNDLISIEIPNTVSKICNHPFAGCTNLTTIILPDGLEQIGYSDFADLKSLTSINIPKSVTKIGGEAFKGCSSLTSINLPDGLTTIGNSAFEECSSLTSINIPDGLTTIGNSAFYGCSSLKSVKLPDGLTTIGSYAFSSCSSLSSINIPDGLTTIGNSAFYGCSSLKSVKLPDGLTTIGSYAFSSCSSLSSINIPSSVKIINYGFCYNSGLSKLIVNNSERTLSLEENFHNYESLRNIFGSELEEIYIGRNFDNSHRYKLNFLVGENLKNATIGGNATIIFSYFFQDLKKLETVILEEGIFRIDFYAFENSSVEKLYLPKSITYISGSAFDNTSIENLYVKWTDETLINSFDPDIFKKAKIKSLYIPKGCKEIYANCELIKAANIENIYEMEE